MQRPGTNADERAESQRAQDGPRRARGSAGASLLLVGGIGIVALGVGLMLLPRLLPAYAWITGNAARHGIAGATITLTGVVWCGLWLAARALTREPVREEPKGPNVGLLLEQVTSDLAQLRGGVQDLRVEFVYLKDAVQSAELRNAAADNTSEMDPQAAIFRLAASVDQLSGRLEHRLAMQDAAVHEALRALGQEVQTAQSQVADVRAQIEIAAAASASERDEHAAAFENAPEREIEIDPGYEERDEDLHVYVDLEEAQPDLGLLDELDDLGAPHAPKTSPSIRPSIQRERAEIDLFDEAAPGGLRGPLPSHVSQGEHDKLAAKLADLRALMSDPIVRRALGTVPGTTPTSSR